MADIIKLKAEVRKSKQRLAEKQAMGNIYGHGIEGSILFTIDEMQLRKAFRKSGYNHVVEIEVDGKSYEVVFKEIYRRNLQDALHHVDMYAIKRGEKIEAAVPIIIIGEAPGVRTGGVLVQFINELSVTATPANMPEKLEADVSGLEEPGDSISIADLSVKDLDINEAPEKLVAKLDISRAAESEEDEDAEGEETTGAADVPSAHGGDDGEQE